VAEQICIQYRNMPTACIGGVVMSTLLLVIMGNAIHALSAALWLSALYAQAGVRYLQWRAYWKADPPADDAARWGRYAAWGSGLSGTLWGLGSVMLFPHNVLEFQLLLFVLIGMGSASVYASASYMPAFHAYLSPAVAPVGVMLALQGDTLHLVLAAMTFFYIPVTMRFAHNLNRSLRESIALRFENLELIEQLRRQTEAAERANTAKSRFLAAASHDLRQPMHALSLFVERLKGDELGPAQRQSVERIVRAVNALDGLFDALLDMSRLDAGLVRTHAEHFPLGALLDRIREEYAPVAHARGLRLTVVPSSAVVVSDLECLERILRNLVENALRYTPSGGVVVGCRRRSGRLVMQVWDSGPGIPVDQRAQIFLEFHQMGDTERDRAKGLGLGLAIVDRLVRLLGHGLQLDSRLGRGSVFSVTMPQGRLADCTPLAGPSALQAELNFDGELIAVIDDEAEILDGMRDLLTRWNCAVVTADSGDALRAQLAQGTRIPRLLICDHRPRERESGLDVIAMLREEFNRDIPALLITGDTDARLREAETATLSVLHKPLQPARLRAAMRLFLRGGAAAEVPAGSATATAG
jgi:signal transduction histidine kinase/CheY-like chemotaxis protein